MHNLFVDQIDLLCKLITIDIASFEGIPCWGIIASLCLLSPFLFFSHKFSLNMSYYHCLCCFSCLTVDAATIRDNFYISCHGIDRLSSTWLFCFFSLQYSLMGLTVSLLTEYVSLYPCWSIHHTTVMTLYWRFCVSYRRKKDTQTLRMVYFIQLPALIKEYGFQVPSRCWNF